MEPSDAKALLEILANRSDAWQALWTTLYTVSAAVVTLVASGKLLPQQRFLASSLLGGLFVFFAAGNYFALSDAREQRQAAVDYAMAVAAEASASDASIVPNSIRVTPAPPAASSANLAKASSAPIARLAQAATPPSAFWLRFYHWGLCIMVLILIFQLPK
jgi:hypothetical protein